LLKITALRYVLLQLFDFFGSNFIDISVVLIYSLILKLLLVVFESEEIVKIYLKIIELFSSLVPSVTAR